MKPRFYYAPVSYSQSWQFTTRFHSSDILL
jgi:hypothetical protein